MSGSAYRLGPRRGGRSSSRIDWERAGRIALVLVFILVLFSYVRPALGLYGSWRESQDQALEVRELKQKNEELRLQAQALAGSGAAERAARKRGLLKPGELGYSVDLGHG